MPYSKISELPPGIKDNLPSAAAKIFMQVFNKTYSACKGKGGKEKDCDQSARAIGWTAVKNAGYKKGKDGKWTKKAHGETNLDKSLLGEILPNGLGVKGDSPVVPDCEPTLLASKEVTATFARAYADAMSRCNNAKGMHCEEEAYVMALVKVRSMYEENPKGNWVPKIAIPPKATL